MIFTIGSVGDVLVISNYRSVFPNRFLHLALSHLFDRNFLEFTTAETHVA